MEDREDAVIAEKVFLDKFAGCRPELDAEEEAVQYRIGSPSLAEHDFEGEVTDWALQYLYAHKCPYNLAAAVAYATCQEIKTKDLHQSVAHQDSHGETVFDSNKLLKLVHWTVHDICERWMATPTKAVLSPEWPVAITAVKNGRRRMEDRHVVISDLGLLCGVECPSPRGFFGVFDGHAGPDAATYAAAHLHYNIVHQPTFSTDIVQAIKDGFQLTDKHFIYKSKQENLKSGSTAVCAIVDETAVHVAWLGDSQAILARQDGVLNLVTPHKPERTDERERIESLGGCVILFGTWRVNGTLAVSRAIGDAEFKPYVSADPDVVSIVRDGTEDFLLVACDGLWDVMTAEDAANIVYAYLVKKPDDLEGAVHKLVQVSVARGSNDNISVIIVLLRSVATIVSSMSCIPESPPASFRIPLATSESMPEGLKQMIENGESPTKILPLPDMGIDEPFTPAPNTLNPFAPSFTPSSARNGHPDSLSSGDLLNFGDNDEIVKDRKSIADLPTTDPIVQTNEENSSSVSAQLWISEVVTSHTSETSSGSAINPVSGIGSSPAPTVTQEFQEYFLAQPETQTILDGVSSVPPEPVGPVQSSPVQLSSFDSKPVELPDVDADILCLDVDHGMDANLNFSDSTFGDNLLVEKLVLPSPPTIPPMSPNLIVASSPPPIPDRPPSSAPPMFPPPASPLSLPQMSSMSPPPIPPRSPEMGLQNSSLPTSPTTPLASPPPIPARSPQTISTLPLTPCSPPPVHDPSPVAETPPPAVSPMHTEPISPPPVESLLPILTPPPIQDPSFPATDLPPAVSPTSFPGVLPVSSPTPSMQTSVLTTSPNVSFESAPPLDLSVQQLLLNSMGVIPSSSALIHSLTETEENVNTDRIEFVASDDNCLQTEPLLGNTVTVELIPETVPVSDDVVDDESEDGDGWRYFQGESGQENQKANESEICGESLVNSTVTSQVTQKSESVVVIEGNTEVITTSTTHISLDTSMDGFCNSSADSSGLLEIRPNLFDSSSDAQESSCLTMDSSAKEDSSPIKPHGDDTYGISLPEALSGLAVDTASNQDETTTLRKSKETTNTEGSKLPKEKGTSNHETQKKTSAPVIKDKRPNAKPAGAPTKTASRVPAAAAAAKVPTTKRPSQVAAKPTEATRTIERKPQPKTGPPPTKTSAASSSASSTLASRSSARPASATTRREASSTLSRQAPASKQEPSLAGSLPKRPSSAGTIPRTTAGSRPLSNGLKKTGTLTKPGTLNETKSSGDSTDATKAATTTNRSVSQTKVTSTLKTSRPPPAKRSTAVPGAKSDTALVAATASKQTKETVNKQISTTVRQTTKTTVRLTQQSRTIVGTTANGTTSGSKTARAPGPPAREPVKKISTPALPASKVPPKKAAPATLRKAPTNTKPLKASSSKQSSAVSHVAGTSSTAEKGVSAPSATEKVKENILSEKGALDEQSKEPPLERPNDILDHGDELSQMGGSLATNGSVIESLVGLGSGDTPNATIVSSQELV